MSPTHFSLEAIKLLGPSLGNKRTRPTRPEIYPRFITDLHTLQYLVVRVSKKE